MGDFEFLGINHLALVCEDMGRTVDFYQGVLGMPLVKTIALPDGGQHFFFDCGGGNLLAFFWFPETSPRAPGVASPANRVGLGHWFTAHGSMNHVAFHVPPEKIDEYVERLRERDVECSEVANHDDSEFGIAAGVQDGVFVRSVYFMDPDGVMLEFAADTRPFGPDDVRHDPIRTTDRES